MNLQVLYGLWDELSRQPRGDDGKLCQPFLGFPAGTPVELVQQSFTSQNSNFSPTDLLAGVRQPEWGWSVITLEESGEGNRVRAHGVRFNRDHALSLALQVAKDLKSAVEAEFMRDDPVSFEPLIIEPLVICGKASGYALMATAHHPYATIEVRRTQVSMVVGEPLYEEPLSSFDEKVELVA